MVSLLTRTHISSASDKGCPETGKTLLSSTECLPDQVGWQRSMGWRPCSSTKIMVRLLSLPMKLLQQGLRKRGTVRKKKKLFITTPADMSFLCTSSSCPYLNSATLLRIFHKLGDLLLGSSSSNYPFFGFISALYSVFCAFISDGVGTKAAHLIGINKKSVMMLRNTT